MRRAASSRTLWPEGRLIVDLLDGAVGLDRDRDDETAVQPLVARGLRIVQVADALDLLPPVLDVAREAVFLRARADEVAPRPLLVGVPVARDLRFQPRDLEAALHDLRSPAVAASLRAPAAGAALAGGAVSTGVVGLRLRHELARFALELLDTPQRELHFGVGLLVGHHRQRALRAALLVRVAAAVEIVLRQRIGTWPAPSAISR